MKSINTFFIIGTVGMIITAVMHIFLALLLKLEHTTGIFTSLYINFLIFLWIGFHQMKKLQPIRVKRK